MAETQNLRITLIVIPAKPVPGTERGAGIQTQYNAGFPDPAKACPREGGDGAGTTPVFTGMTNRGGGESVALMAQNFGNGRINSPLPFG